MYTPHRDNRFQYMWELMSYLERRQCHSCAFKHEHGESSNGQPYTMCGKVESLIIQEMPVADLDDRGEHGVVCTKYMDEVLAEESHPDQLPLF